MGLDPGVNIPVTSPVAVSAHLNQPSDSPAQQDANAQQVLGELQQPKNPKPKTEQDVLALKDQAIEDYRKQNDGLQKNIAALTDKIGTFVEALAAPPGKPQKRDIPLPTIPEDINERPAEEQVKILTEAYQKMTETVKNEISDSHEKLKNFLGPMAFEVQELKVARAEQAALAAYPRFDIDKHREEFHKKVFTTGLSPREVAKLIADPSELLEPESPPDASMETLPSVSASSGHPNAPKANDDADRQEYIKGLNSAIRASQQRGNSAQAGRIFRELLKTKMPYVTVRSGA